MHFRGIANGQKSSMGVWTSPIDTFDGVESWNKSPVSNPVLTAGASGQPDENGIQDPCIVAGTSQLLCYYMGTYAGTGPSVIMRATSSADGLTWTKSGIVTIPGGGNLQGGTPLAVRASDGLIHLFYTKGRSGNGAQNGWEYYKRVSTDGNGTSFGAETLAFTVSGVSGAFDSFSIITARIFKEVGDPYYYLIYGGCSFDDDYPEGFGIARSTDLVTWERSPANPILLRGATGTWDEGAMWSGALARINGQLFMAYEGCGTINAAAGSSASNTARDTQYGGYNTTAFSQVGLAFDRADGQMSDWFPSDATLPTGTYYIRNMLTGKFLAPDSETVVNGTGVVQLSDDKIGTAKWHIEKIAGFYRISSVQGGVPGTRVLEISGGSRLNTAKASLWASTGSQNQQWHLVKVGKSKSGFGHYEIVNRFSGQTLETWAMRSADKALVLQLPSVAGVHQRWEFIAAL